MEALGINGKILIVQIVNFLILFFLLKWLLYKPVTNLLDERRKKIENSLELAEANQKKAEELEIKIKEVQEQSRKDAKEILDQAKRESEELKKQFKDQAQKESADLLKLAENRIAQQKEELKKELRADTARLVISATGKLLGKTLDEKDQKNLVEESIKEIEGIK